MHPSVLLVATVATSSLAAPIPEFSWGQIGNVISNAFSGWGQAKAEERQISQIEKQRKANEVPKPFSYIAKDPRSQNTPSPGSASTAEMNNYVMRKSQSQNRGPSRSDSFGGSIGTGFDVGNPAMYPNNAAVPSPVAAAPASVPNPALGQQAGVPNPALQQAGFPNPALAQQGYNQAVDPNVIQQPQPDLNVVMQQQAAAAQVPQYNVPVAGVNNAVSDYTTGGYDTSLYPTSEYVDQTQAGVYDTYGTGASSPTSKNALNAALAMRGGNGKGGDRDICFNCS